MTVLWFSNVDVELGVGLNDESRGWLSTLALELSDSIDLHIVSINPYKKGSHNGKWTTHYLKPKYFRSRLLIKFLLGNANLEGDLVPAMLEVLKLVKPDLVHIHGTERQFIRLIPHINTESIPSIVSIQGLTSVIYKKYTAGYSSKFVNSFVYEYGFNRSSLFPRTHASRLKEFSRKALQEENLFPLVQNFAGRTDWDRTITRVLSPESNYYHVDRVLKPVFYKSRWRPLSDARVYRIHTTTGNSLYKGFEVIAEASYLLELSGLSFQWHIAGLSEDDWSVRAARKKLGSRLSLKSLVFLGKIGTDILVNSMLSSDLYVSASHIENSPNNIAEAMLIGMPCIATYVGGTNTYIQDKSSGILVPPGDAHALAGAIFEASQNRDKMIELGNRAHELSGVRHDKTRIKSSIIAAYEDITGIK